MGFAAKRPILVRICTISWLAFGSLQGLAPAEPAGPALVRQDFVRQDPPTTQRARVVLEVTGEMRNPTQADQDGQSAAEGVPISVHGEFLYREHVLQRAQITRAIRWYDQAQVTIQTGDQKQQPHLRQDRRAILFERNGNSPALFTSPQGTLTRTEQELLLIPAASPLIHRILPEQPVSVEETWKPHDDAVAQLLNMQAISEQSVHGKLVSIQDDTAYVDLSGKVSGMSENVLSRVQLQGKLNVHLPSGQVTWATLLIQENREGSATRPSFEITAKLRLRMETTELSGDLEKFVSQADATEAGPDAIHFVAVHGDLELQHDPGWRVTSDRHDRTALQLVRNGALVANCQISPLPDLPIGKNIAIEEFRQDVQNAIRQYNGQIAGASTATDERFSVLRVVAVGEVNKVPIQWTYFHVVAPNGRRTVLAFTLNHQDAERFGTADLELIQGLSFPESTDQATLPARKRKE